MTFQCFVINLANYLFDFFLIKKLFSNRKQNYQLQPKKKMCKADFHTACRWIHCGNSVHLDAFMKLENVHYFGKRLSESAVELKWKWIFFRLRKYYEVKSVEERKTKGSEPINQYSALNLNQSSSINPRNQSSHRRLPVRYKCVFV